ncbi:MAG: Regulatory protein ada [Candidatus Nomurabacteria bacterium GW2011_GWA1_35_8]|uniref:Regulatory protein ada n=1 Tax=Candidatus Nomurabacteria bacterium GW2011_GWA1_35_8 TaxID=1618727 RepID=A0A0G0CV93_9BACT|nr:MAG: Regulatory protein ada [Candidatus Nomurabacteria bacterium GW2011_GWA1_35_8]
MKIFTKKVYGVVKKIPKGKVLTYKEVAKKAGNVLAVRAVGNILNKNHNPKIPCHRVIRSDGKIGGYNKGVKKKKEILRKEGINMI